MRTVLLSVMLLFATLVARAQSLTMKDIKGNWKMVAFDMSGIYYEWGIDSLALSTELKQEVAPGTEAAVVAEIKSRLNEFTDGYLKISDNLYVQKLMGEELDGSYTLIQKGSNQYLRVVNNNKNKDVDEIKVQKKSGWLYISMPADDGSETVLIFEKD